MKVSLIFAADENNGIGKDNDLPWPKMSADMKRFKQLTMGHHVIMGRKTFQSMTSDLPGRTKIVVSRNSEFTVPENIILTPSLDAALKYARDHNEYEAFIIGGAAVFKEAVSLADIFYLTRIHHVFEADTFIPEIESGDWKISDRQDFEPDEKNPYPYSFLTLERV